eukprot:1197153-Ditylum_brightwellii.AAC.1
MKVSMKEYIEESIEEFIVEFPDELDEQCTSPAADHLFKVNEHRINWWKRRPSSFTQPLQECYLYAREQGLISNQQLLFYRLESEIKMKMIGRHCADC